MFGVGCWMLDVFLLFGSCCNQRNSLSSIGWRRGLGRGGACVKIPLSSCLRRCRRGRQAVPPPLPRRGGGKKKTPPKKFVSLGVWKNKPPLPSHKDLVGEP